MTTNRILRVLFATKLTDSRLSIYGKIVPPTTITQYKEKVQTDMKAGLYIATVGDYKNIKETKDVLEFFNSGDILFRIKGMVEDEIGHYMQIEFEDNEAARLVLQKIRNNWIQQLDIKQLGKISTAEYFHDAYLQKSMKSKFFKWLRWQISFIDNYYCKQVFYKMLPK